MQYCTINCIKIDIIETEHLRHNVIDCLVARHASPFSRLPILYINLEDLNLIHEATMTILTILIDIIILKVFSDVCNHSYALFAHSGVALEVIENVQLMESASRMITASIHFFLARCSENGNSGEGLANWELA